MMSLRIASAHAVCGFTVGGADADRPPMDRPHPTTPDRPSAR